MAPHSDVPTTSSSLIVSDIERFIAQGIAEGFPQATDCFIHSLKLLRVSAVATKSTPISKAEKQLLLQLFAQMYQFLSASEYREALKDFGRIFGGVRYLIQCWGQPRSEEKPFAIQGSVLQGAILCQTIETALTFLCLTIAEQRINSDLTAARTTLFRSLLDTSGVDIDQLGEA
ncbi:hypothetical protein [Devosia alba]|uniref:hypothetical protein n=1 Tax=Devosia alba TaxID=3152360 RepID=UPI003266F37E